VISGFYRDADDSCALLCRYSAFSGFDRRFGTTYRSILILPLQAA